MGTPLLNFFSRAVSMRRAVRQIVLSVCALGVTASAASAETLLMPKRDMLMGTSEVVWGVTTLANTTTTYSIDFGDGSADATGTVTDRSYIAVNHTWATAGTFTVTLQTTNGGTIETATVDVRVFDPNPAVTSAETLRGVNINRAIENGLRYLWTTQTNRATNFPAAVTTNWPNSYPESFAALVVLAFENHGYVLPNSNAAPTGVYEKYIVRRGLNFVIDELRTFNLTLQAAGNPCVGSGAGPDPDGAGTALCVGLRQNQQQEGYATSLAILPLAGSNALNRTVAEITGSQNAGYVVGKSYGEVLQRLVNGLAWGQGESGYARGGWAYSFNAGNTDGSTIGWNVLSLLDAAAAGIVVPAFVKTEFVNFAIPYGINNDGSFDYTADNNPNYNNIPNMAKNGIGMQALFYGDMVGIGDPKVLAGRNGINSRWNAPVAGDSYPCDIGHNKGCGYAMFNVFKGLKLQGVTTLPNVARAAGPGSIPAGDWYADYVDWLLANQSNPTSTTGGNWPTLDFSCCEGGERNHASAALAELILSSVALIAPDPTLFSTVGLAPATALVAPGSNHTVTATATSSGGAPVPGATVRFEVLSGPNAGQTGQSTTNGAGQATFTYAGTGGSGRDEIQAFIGNLGSNKVEAIWAVPSCSPTGLSVALSAPMYPLDQGWRGVSIIGAPGAKVTQVCQDEPPNFENIAAWAIDADGVGTSAASVRAQRSGTRTAPGNGRVYHVYFTSSACTGEVTVSVPTVAGGTAVDGGPLFNSVTGASCAVPTVPAVVPTPNVIGQTQSAATSALGTAGLFVGTVSQLNSPTVPAGQVMSQSPVGGTNVAVGSAVAITISSGPSSLPVPNVIGTPQATAAANITSGGFTVGAISQVNDPTIAAGIVMSQNPVGGTQIPPGSPISLVVSLGPAQTTVPNVVGRILAGAVNSIGGAGLNFGTVDLVYDPVIADGLVISQSPVGGTVVSPGTAVNFVLSLGPQPIPVPNVVGQLSATAQTNIVGGSLAVGTVLQVNDAVVPVGHVVSQTPLGGSMVKPGSSVNLTVSLGPVMVTVPTVTDLPQSAAQTAITGVGLAVGTVTQSNHPSVPAGSVISQNPAGGASVALGSAVSLNVSLGPTPVLVPNLAGQAQVVAQGNITGAGLVVGAVTTANSPTVPTGNVMGQNPLAGSSVLPGTPVNIVVSLGPVMVTVPNVVGQTQATAQTAIANIGLFLQSITFTTNPAPAGQVFAQSPAAGASVVLGSPMTLSVSLGANSVTVPNVIGKTQLTASANIAAAGLVVGTVTNATSQTVPAGSVIDQSPVGSTVAPQGSAVNLLVSLGAVSAVVPNVVGNPEATAVASILGANLGAMVTYGTSPVVTAGNVISQSPAAGANVAEGSTVTIQVSTGLSAATVPNVIGQTQADAATALTNAGLAVGTVTQQSSAMAAGLVVSQSPSAGASAPGGSLVALVVSTGPVAGEPAFLELHLSTQVLGSGAAASVTSSVLDGFTVPVLPAPSITYQVVAGPGATGALPYVSGDQLLTAANTRGPYTLHGVVGGTVVSADVEFSVLDGAATSTNAAKFIKLGQAEATVAAKVDDLLRAYQTLGTPADVAAARTALTAALLQVPITGRHAMQRSAAVAPEQGFLPSLAQLTAAGFPLTAQDVAFGNLINQISDKLAQITSFYESLDPNGTVGGGNSVQQLNTLNSELAALQSQLVAIKVTPHGIVRSAPQINRLLGNTIPAHLHAVTNRVVSIAQQYPDPAGMLPPEVRMKGTQEFFAGLKTGTATMTPDAFYRQNQPAFFGLLGLMGGSSLQMKLVNEVYGPIMKEVSQMMAVLIANSVVTGYFNTAYLGDLISGGSLSFHAPLLGGSTIEGYGFDTTNVAGNETWFVGPEAFNAAQDLIEAFKPGQMQSLQDVFNYFEGIIDAIEGAGQAYNNAHTQPSAVYQGWCILDPSSSCTSLEFGGGFPDVNTTRFPSPVIVILHNLNNGSWSSGIFNFVP